MLVLSIASQPFLVYNYLMANKAGYEYLLAYKITVPIYDYTVEFCDRYVGKYSRHYEQMTQAARSGTENIAEGYKEKSLENYIKLTGVARGSQEELLKDFLTFARQKKIPITPISLLYLTIKKKLST